MKAFIWESSVKFWLVNTSISIGITTMSNLLYTQFSTRVLGFSIIAVIIGTGCNIQTSEESKRLSTGMDKLDDKGQFQHIHSLTLAPLSPETIKVWEKAGAVYGHIASQDVFGNRDVFGLAHFESGSLNDGGFPVFNVDNNLQLSDLPIPSVPFGLSCEFLSGTFFDDLAALKHLQLLYIHTSQNSTSPSMKQLSALKSLQSLILNGKAVTDDDVKELANLKQLKELNIVDSRLTNAGMKEIANLEQLETLIIDGRDRKVTDAGIKELAALKQIKDLRVCPIRVVGLRKMVHENAILSQ
jgi:hypothetical protein